MVGEGISLVDVIHMMLHCRIPLLQGRVVPVRGLQARGRSGGPRILPGMGPRRNVEALVQTQEELIPCQCRRHWLSHTIPIADVILYLFTLLEFHLHDRSRFFYMTDDCIFVQHRFGAYGPRR